MRLALLCGVGVAVLTLGCGGGTSDKNPVAPSSDSGSAGGSGGSGSSGGTGSAGGAGTPAGSAGGNGTLNVMLTDSPFSDAKALLVTFSEVSVHSTGGAFVNVPFAGGAASRTCDLKKLNGPTDVLGTAALTPGHYTQIRLMVTRAVVYLTNPSVGPACSTSIAAPGGGNAEVKIPSGELKLNREFDLTSGSATTITLDFDGDKSVKKTGNGKYMMTPVISIVSVQ
jgi:hypothetical protein